MTDAEYLFKLTERERKRNARGAKNKIKGGGGAVRLPSDNLTKKEREAMNGETVTYLGIKTWNRGRNLPDAAGWQRFISKVGGEEEKAAPEEAAPEPLTIHDECEAFAREQAEQIDAERIAGMLRALIGTGAKVTIEVTL